MSGFVSPRAAGRNGGLATASRYDVDEISAPGRQVATKKLWQHCLDQVDPERKLPEAERLRRAEAARRLHYGKLAYKRIAAQARARRRAELGGVE